MCTLLFTRAALSILWAWECWELLLQPVAALWTRFMQLEQISLGLMEWFGGACAGAAVGTNVKTIEESPLSDQIILLLLLLITGSRRRRRSHMNQWGGPTTATWVAPPTDRDSDWEVWVSRHSLALKRGVSGCWRWAGSWPSRSLYYRNLPFKI